MKKITIPVRPHNSDDLEMIPVKYEVTRDNKKISRIMCTIDLDADKRPEWLIIDNFVIYRTYANDEERPIVTSWQTDQNKNNNVNEIILMVEASDYIRAALFTQDFLHN